MIFQTFNPATAAPREQLPLNNPLMMGASPKKKADGTDEPVSRRQPQDSFSLERRAANGNYVRTEFSYKYQVCYACGPLRRPRYINEKIELELIEFKKEIEEKFAKSTMNKNFAFPR